MNRGFPKKTKAVDCGTPNRSAAFCCLPMEGNVCFLELLNENLRMIFHAEIFVWGLLLRIWEKTLGGGRLFCKGSRVYITAILLDIEMQMRLQREFTRDFAHRADGFTGRNR